MDNTVSNGTHYGRSNKAGTSSILSATPHHMRFHRAHFHTNGHRVTGEESKGTANTVSGGNFYGPVLQGHDIHVRFQVPASLAPGPTLLPRDTSAFVGRSPELKRLRATAKAGGAIMVTAIAGTAGVGKTALAVHAAHQLISDFPDGQLYADLHGFTEDQSPLAPAEVLSIFLSSLGLKKGEIPSRLDEKTARFRQLVAGRRMLILLDNVATEQQVAPLLPGTGSSLVIITSRNMLAGLELNERISLDVLSAAQAYALLVRLMPHAPAAEEKAAVADIARWCGYLPLALRICGHLLATHPTWTAGYLARQLEHEHHRLDRLSAGTNKQVRAAFTVSYRQLSELDARVFRRLGLHPGIDFDSGATASIADIHDGKVASALERLATVHLIEEKSEGRYQMHDLIRLFATEATHREDDAETRRQAMAGLMIYYLYIVDFIDSAAGQDQRYEELRDMEVSQRQALAIFELDRINIISVQEYAASHNYHYMAAKLGRGMARSLSMLHYLDDWMKVNKIALSAARAESLRDDEGTLLAHLGNIYTELREFDKAIEFYEQSLIIRQELGDRGGAGIIFNNLGNIYTELREFDKAIEFYEQSLAIHRELDQQADISNALNNLGATSHKTGRIEDAVDYYQQSLVIVRSMKDRYKESSTLSNLGAAYVELSQFEDALGCLREALVIDQETGDRHSECGTLINLGIAYSNLENYKIAMKQFKRALAIAQKIGYRHREGTALHELGMTCMRLKRFDEAIDFFQQSIVICRTTADPEGEVASLQELGRSAMMMDETDIDLVRRCFERAAELCVHFDSRRAMILRAIVRQLSDSDIE